MVQKNGYRFLGQFFGSRLQWRKVSLSVGFLLILCLLPSCVPNQDQKTQVSTQVAQTVESMLTKTAIMATLTSFPTATLTSSPTATLTSFPTATLTSSPTATLTPVPPSQTPTLSPVPSKPYTGTPTIISGPCDQATLIGDVTIPDGTVIRPDVSFTKTWRLQNTGSCNWTTGYALVFYSGDLLGGPKVVSLPKNVNPGDMIDLSVNLIAPHNSGIYQGFWMLRNSNGNLFGVAPNASQPIWERVVVTNQTVFAVIKVETSVSPSDFTGVCPAILTFRAVIYTNGPGRVTYSWVRSDGSKGAEQTVVYTAAGSQTVKDSWSIGASGAVINGWEKVYINEPNHQYFYPATFSLSCYSPTFTSTVTLAPTSTPTKISTTTLIPAPTETVSPTSTSITTRTATSANTSTATPTSTVTLAPTNTATKISTATLTPAPTETASSTSTTITMSTATSANTSTATPTETSTVNPTSPSTPTWTASPTETLTQTAVETHTPSPTASIIETQSSTPMETYTPTETPSEMTTFTPTTSPSPTVTLTPTATPTLAPCNPYPSKGILTVQDSWVDQTMPDTTYGTDPLLHVGSSGNVHHRALIQFDLNSIPAGSKITNAILYINAENENKTLVEVLRITSPWDESVTWNTQPTLDSTPVGKFMVTKTACVLAGYIDPAIIQTWLDSPSDNYGLALSALTGSEDVSLTSRKGSLPPLLVVSYSLPGTLSTSVKQSGPLFSGAYTTSTPSTDAQENRLTGGKVEIYLALLFLLVLILLAVWALLRKKTR